MQELIEIILKYIENKLERENVEITNLKSLKVPSQVNFLFEGILDDKQVVVKVNFFERSLLYTYEKYKEIGHEEFKNLIYSYPYNQTTQNEVNSFESLKSLDISIPKILHFIKPNILIIEKLKGKTLKDLLNHSEVVDSPAVLDLVFEILKIYKVTRVSESPILEISDNKIILTDNHLNKKTMYNGVHESTIGRLQKVIQQKQNLVHGDLKLNNIFLDKNKIKLIDPHLHFSNPFMDLGWFTIMAYIYAISRGKRDIVYNFLTNFYTIYSDKTGLNVKEVEEPSLILGVMQINNLLRRERRPNIEWLGDEMLDMYNLQSNLSLLYKTIINDGKILSLDQLFLQQGKNL